MQSLPNKGIASDTWGNVSATRLRNTVSDRRIVTPETKEFRFRFEKYNNNHTKTNDTIKMEIIKRTFMYVQVYLYLYLYFVPVSLVAYVWMYLWVEDIGRCFGLSRHRALEVLCHCVCSRIGFSERLSVKGRPSGILDFWRRNTEVWRLVFWLFRIYIYRFL